MYNKHSLGNFGPFVSIADRVEALFEHAKRVSLPLSLIHIFPLETAVACATINPAKSLKIDDEYGSLEKGKKANVVLLGKDLELKAVIKDGKRI